MINADLPSNNRTRLFGRLPFSSRCVPPMSSRQMCTSSVKETPWLCPLCRSAGKTQISTERRMRFAKLSPYLRNNRGCLEHAYFHGAPCRSPKCVVTIDAYADPTRLAHIEGYRCIFIIIATPKLSHGCLILLASFVVLKLVILHAIPIG